MSELWMPRKGKVPNISNLYDLMEHYQEVLDEIKHYEEKIRMAHFVTDALYAAFSRLEPARREVTVVTDLAIFDDTEEENAVGIASNIGLTGSLALIQCVEYDEVLPMSLTLELDVMHAFSPQDPDINELIVNSASAPIASVQYIETLAS